MKYRLIELDNVRGEDISDMTDEAKAALDELEVQVVAAAEQTKVAGGILTEGTAEEGKAVVDYDDD